MIIKDHYLSSFHVINLFITTQISFFFPTQISLSYMLCGVGGLNFPFEHKIDFLGGKSIFP